MPKLVAKQTIDDITLQGKAVLVRVDFNVPLEKGKVTSNKRIVAALPTINKIIKDGGKAILLSHLGRVETEADKAESSLRPVAAELQKLLGKPVIFVPATRGMMVENAIRMMKPGSVIMLENTRFEDLNGKAESKNNPELGKYWASLGDVFVNDAFGTAHRAHASNVGIATYIKTSAVGYLVDLELKMLGRAVDVPKRPLVAILGGAKVSDKIAVIENLIAKADKILIGGGMSFTFLKAQGYSIGSSLVESDFLALAKKLLKDGKDKIVLPVDHAVSDKFADNKREVTKGVDIAPGKMGLDIGTKTITLFAKELAGAKTVVWNGPMGVAEFNNFKIGTEAVATAITKLPGVFSVIGGGDSAAAAIKLGFEKKFSHISTGGGASLEYLEGKVLPGIAAIQDQSKKK